MSKLWECFKFYLIALCVTLLIPAAVSSYAQNQNLVSDPSFTNFTVGTTYTTTGGIVDWWFGQGSNGSVTVSSDAQDGDGKCLMITGGTSNDNYVAPPRITVIPGHEYYMKFWAKTDSTNAILNSWVAGWTSDLGWTGVDGPASCEFHLTQQWGPCVITFTAKSDTTLVAPNFFVKDIGTNVYLDNVQIYDATTMTGNLFPDPEFAAFPIGFSTSTVPYYANDFRFFSVNGADTSLDVVESDDGHAAIKMTRTGSGGDAGLDLLQPRGYLPAMPGHTYRLSFRGKSDNWGKIACGAMGTNSVMSGWTNSSWYEVNMSPTWTSYSSLWTADSSTYYMYLYFRPWSVGNIYFTDVSVEDVTPSILTGTVTNGLSGNPVPGVTVKVSSAVQTFTATSDSSGVYKIENIPYGLWNVSASASGYAPYCSAPNAGTYNVLVSDSTTLNISMMPSGNDPSSLWNVFDKFERDDNSSLGTTEDTNLVPWEKTPACSDSSISGYRLFLNPFYGDNSSFCGVYLGRGFAPANFNMSIIMTWQQNQLSQWSGIAYRQTQPGVYNKGYFLCCTAPSYDESGNASIQLKYNDVVVASASVSLGSNGWSDSVIQLKVNGNRHIVMFNGNKVIDKVDNQSSNGGYVGLFCDSYNSVYWDDLNINAVPNGMITGSVYDSVTKSVITDATITIAETAQQIQPSDGTYSLSMVPGTYTLTANATGYEPRIKTISVESSQTTTVNFNMLKPAVNVNSVSDAKTQPDGTQVAITESLVAPIASNTFTDGSYYLENADRAYGIKVINGKTVTTGSRVSGIVGIIDTDANGERYIDAFNMNVTDGNPINALGMSNKTAVGSMAQGMLVKTWGNITSVAADKSYFYINDGSNIDDGSGNLGIRVDLTNQTISRLAGLFVDEAVSITGAMGYINNGTASVKVIRPKSSLDINNTVVNNVTVTSADTSWILQSNSGQGSVVFASAADTLYGSGNVLMSEGADGSGDVINLRTTNCVGLKIADITELSISNYMASINPTGAKGIGVRMSVNLDDTPDDTGSYVDDILTCDPLYNPYTYALCRQNSWVTFDALNAGYWYSTNKLDGTSDAGPWKTLKDYLTLYPNAKIADYPTGGLRFFMGGSSPHWDNVTGFIDNIRVGTKDGVTVYNFE